MPDALVNPRVAAHAALPDVLGLLEAAGYGVLQLPPVGDEGPLLAVIADQVAEYAHHGYAVAAVGVRGVPGGGLHWLCAASAVAASGSPARRVTSSARKPTRLPKARSSPPS